MVPTLRSNSRKLKGQFFTREAVAEFMLDAVRPQASWRVIDPACGNGVFLKGALQRGCAEVWGVDSDPNLLEDAERNCGRDTRLHLLHADGLTCEDADPALAHGSFDLVVGNPPYSAGLGRITDRQLMARFQLAKGALATGAGVPAEVLFLEQFVRLAKRDGLIAVVVPDGILANTRHTCPRAYITACTRLIAVVALPRAAFKGTGTTARTAILLMQRLPERPCPGAEPCPRQAPPLMADLSQLGANGMPALEDGLAAVARALRGEEPSPPPGCVIFRAGDGYAEGFSAPEAIKRLDPWYWRPEHGTWLNTLRGGDGKGYRLLRLSELITRISYGPVVTGPPPERYDGCDAVLRIGQAQLAHCGVNFATATPIAPGSKWDSGRARAHKGDILMARSGEGGIGAGKMAIVGSSPMGVDLVVDSFVDVITVGRVEPASILAFLKGRYGQGQIRRLMNGVGTPNLSFKEIGELQVPELPDRLQTECGLACEMASSRLAMALASPPGRYRDRQMALATQAMEYAIRRVERYIESCAADGPPKRT